MKNIYITAIPFQQNFIIKKKPYHPVNFESKWEGKEFAYLLAPVIADSMLPGDEGKVIVLCQSDGAKNPNLDILKEEIALAGFPDMPFTIVSVPESQDEDTIMGLFRSLILQMEDNSYYYADITFGTKTFSLIEMTALSYAEHILKNTQVDGVYYQEIKRENGKDVAANAYDMKFLHSLSSLMAMISDLDDEEKKDFILSLIREGA